MKLLISLLLLVNLLSLASTTLAVSTCNGILATEQDSCGSHGVCNYGTCYCVDSVYQNSIYSAWTADRRQTLVQGESLVSTDGTFTLAMKSSGVLSLMNSITAEEKKSYTATGGSGPYVLALATDGSLSIKGNGGSTNLLGLASSCGSGTAPFRLVLQNDGNLVLYGAQEEVCWETHTWTAGLSNTYLWEGLNCTTPLCYNVLSTSSLVCSGHGSCPSPNNCVCSDGYHGNKCQFFNCISRDNCSLDHGSCISANTCSCQSGWKGNVNCSQFSCDGVNYCSGHGQCVSNNTCQCDDYWHGENCKTPSCELVDNCNGHGSCVSNNTCMCYSGWKGDSNCSLFSCEALNHCNNHGQCVSNNSCECNSGWKGNSHCSAISCDSLNHCSGHGSCISNNTCSCESGWKSDSSCSSFSCEVLNECNGNGHCVSNNTCECNNGWLGNSECSNFTCETLNNCSGHGQCVSNNSCSCESGFKGNAQCSVISCDALNDCYGNGNCVSNNTCECQVGWKGNSQCSLFTCEILNNCSHHGDCVSNNTCSCHSGWRGNSQCSQISCDALNECSGHGSCVSNNSCECNSGWKGNSQCSTISCDALSNCSNHGTCISNNTCSCNTHWKYLDCSIIECLMDLDSDSNELTCSTGSETETFVKMSSNTWEYLVLSLANEKQLIYVEDGSTFGLNLSSNSFYFSTSSTRSNEQFYSNVTNFMIQNAKSELIHIQLSKQIKYYFSGLIFDVSNYNYTCLRFDYDSNSWTNQLVTSSFSTSNQIICSTSYISSVAVQRSALTNRSASSTVSTGDLSVILIAILVPTFFLLMCLCMIALIVSIVMFVLNRKQQGNLPSQSSQFEL
ncbi:predicted protein [Naegleria gruberi]|uniref:Predicted protein n=1 Tax=Naegleria gruberi TaxID=5762 RepID=D2W3E9_NAEGR|nr:uncharacterized protein NAEGRDRAFT_75920 [Naegleria gruberi]EFC36407.1 predicted protein [Naegleria gruberi]|eukprot:XP_002669151.1 predicted protein [Naegleria gruberi strain NEG-M]